MLQQTHNSPSPLVIRSGVTLNFDEIAGGAAEGALNKALGLNPRQNWTPLLVAAGLGLLAGRYMFPSR